MTRDVRSMLEAALVGNTAKSFARLSLREVKETHLAVRVASNEVCRENVWRESRDLVLVGHQPGKMSRMRVKMPARLEDLQSHIDKLAVDLEQQSIDEEADIPTTSQKRHEHRLAERSLEDSLSLERLYRAIALEAQRVAAASHRLTGYVEVLQTETVELASDGFELVTSDAGAQLSFTVDDELRGTSGVGKRSLTAHTLDMAEAEIVAAVEEAEKYCSVPGQKGEILVGDHTAILSPLAFYDILRTVMMYGLFDGRKIDEGRTYLSRTFGDLRFDPCLKLQLRQRLGSLDEQHVDMPFNYRGVACDDLTLIEGGRLRDVMIEPYWAKTTGKRESHGRGFLPPLVCEASPSEQLNIYESLEALIASTERGVFIADTWYLRMVSEMDGVITGMTRDGFFLIEEGKLVRPLLHMRWHENPFAVLGRLSGTTSDLQLCGMSRLAGSARGSLAAVPAVRVEDFHFSSVSKF